MKIKTTDLQELEDYGVRIKARNKKKRVPKVKSIKPRNKKKNYRGGFNKYEHDWKDDVESS